MDSVTIMAARRPSRSRVNPSFSGSLPGFPDVDVDEWLAESLPLPDHFPEPFEDEELIEGRESSVDPLPDARHRASITLEQGATLLFCAAPPPASASSEKTSAHPQKDPASTQPRPSSPKPTLICPILPSSSKPSTPLTPTSSQTPHTSPKPTLTCPIVHDSPDSSTPSTPTTPTPTDSFFEPEVTMRPKPPKTLPKPLMTSSTKDSIVTSCSEPAVTSRISTLVSSPVIKMPDSMERQKEVESKEGLKRITDKYATPAALIRVSSARSRDLPPPPYSRNKHRPSSFSVTVRPPFSTNSARPPSSTNSTHFPSSTNSARPPSSSNCVRPPSSTITSSSTDPPVVRRKDSLPASPTPCITLTPCPNDSQPEVSLVTVNVSVARSRLSTASTRSDSSGAQPPDSVSLTLPDVVGARSSGSGHNLSPVTMSAFTDMTWDKECDNLLSALEESVVVPVPLAPEQGLLSTCRFQSVSGIPLTASLGDGVTERDVQQVEMFYRSHQAEVTVCRCLANLYLGSAASKASSSPLSVPVTKTTTTNGRVSSGNYNDLWQFINTGIPVMVLDSGRHHRLHRLLLVLAEKGTGFVLWKDEVTPLSRYSCPESNFHTLRLSSDVSKLVGLSFDDSKAAADFGSYITRQLTSEFDDDDSGTLKKKKGKRRKKTKAERERSTKYKPPKKTEISRPCCFQHVTKLERPQVTGMLPLPPSSLPLARGTLHASFRDCVSLTSRTHSYSSDLSDTLTITSEQ